MDARLGSIPLLLCGHNGPLGIFTAPGFDAASAFHGSLLWLSGADPLLFDWRESNWFSLCQDADAKALPAPKYDPHPVLGPYPVGLSSMVSCELLPNGLQWAAPCKQFWRTQGSSLDDQLGKGYKPWRLVLETIDCYLGSITVIGTV